MQSTNITTKHLERSNDVHFPSYNSYNKYEYEYVHYCYNRSLQQGNIIGGILCIL